jgi:hypothetical protein
MNLSLKKSGISNLATCNLQVVDLNYSGVRVTSSASVWSLVHVAWDKREFKSLKTKLFSINLSYLSYYCDNMECSDFLVCRKICKNSVSEITFSLVNYTTYYDSFEIFVE